MTWSSMVLSFIMCQDNHASEGGKAKEVGNVIRGRAVKKVTSVRLLLFTSAG